MIDIIETDRLAICELSVYNAEFIVELLNSPGWLRYIGDRGVKNIEDACAYIMNGPEASYKKNNFGLWLVKLKENNTSIGICGLIQRDTLPCPDIGFAFLPEYAGQGYAYEAAAAVMEYATGILKIPTIAAITTPDNEHSIRLLHKLGFSDKGMIVMPGETEELMLLEKHTLI